MANSHQKPSAGGESIKHFGGGILGALGRLFCFLFPTRRDNAKQIVVKLLFTASLITLIVSSVYLASYFTASTVQRNLLGKSQEIWHESEIQTANKFSLLREQNPDIRGWISIRNTSIDNPVYQAADDDYYLTHNQNGERSRHGAVYLSCRDVIDSADSDTNLTIYGHNMMDGSMFGTLKRLRNLSFYKENPNISFETPYSEGIYRIFAVFLLNADPQDDNGRVYDVSRDTFQDEADFNAWIKEAYDRSILQTGISVEYGDHLLTLVTCASDFDNARLVVMARRLLPDEDVETDTSRATVNISPRYPKRWYDDKGLDFPY